MSAVCAAIAFGRRGCQAASPAETSGDHSELESRFLREYANAAQEVEETVANLRCEGRFIHNEAYAADAIYFLKGDSAQIIYRYDDEARLPGYPEARVYSMTPGYAFGLEQTVPGGPFVVRSYKEPKEAEDNEKLKATIEAIRKLKLEPFVFAAFTVSGEPVRKIISDPGFSITRINEQGRGGKRQVQIEFTLDSKSVWFTSGRMVFAPDLDWAVRQYEVRGVEDAESTRTDFVDVQHRRWGADGFVFPEQVVWRFQRVYSDGRQPLEYVFQADFEDVQRNVVADEQFTMAAFKLPDLSSSAGRRYYPFDSWLFWLLAINGVVCAGLLYKLRRRRRTGS